MEVKKEQSFASTQIAALFLFAMTATIASYRVTQYIWQKHTIQDAGVTLGQTTRAPSGNIITPESTNPAIPQASSPRFWVDQTTPWKGYQGTTYSYSFSVPQTLTLFPLPGNGPDTFGAAWKDDTKILVGISDLSTDASGAAAGVSKRTYVENWWKQFSGMSGVATIWEFTNTHGLKGYKTQYLLNSGNTTDVNVFFEIPQRPELIIRIVNAFIDPDLFDRIVDTIAWTPVQITATGTPMPTQAPTATTNTPTPIPTTAPTVAPTVTATPTTTPVPTQADTPSPTP